MTTRTSRKLGHLILACCLLAGLLLAAFSSVAPATSFADETTTTTQPPVCGPPGSCNPGPPDCEDGINPRRLPHPPLCP
jgi:hypothetical protein